MSNTSQIPNATYEKWKSLILGIDSVHFEFFPLKLLLRRLKLQVKRDPDP